ncbi:hypothetical protein TWF102_005088 [Orbilia oligospora]|uniref:F-box domain-containing protein n=1 Tax=Orbilia oligospora TaxID=2813651 RepID=A0A7C8JBV9_ORBOL|nr:hypothetical protein TWF706_001649 [Orbilia oligospora]KAF3100707.1 hypothetical protein TWF102_005088 [Orbilia oligospora]KAF3103944.1 hypothetical protein TWF103_007094 [Orbilia oligospora]
MATQVVFRLPELLGQILSYLDPLFLIYLRRVSTAFNDAITTSKKVRFYIDDNHIYGYNPSDVFLRSERIFTPAGLHFFSGFWKELAPYLMRIEKGASRNKIRMDINTGRIVLPYKIRELYAKYEPIITEFRMINENVRVRGWDLIKSKHWREVALDTVEYEDIFLRMARHPLYKEYLPFRIMVDLLSFAYEFAFDENLVEQSGEQSGAGAFDKWNVFAGFKIDAVVYDEENEEESQDSEEGEDEGGEDDTGEVQSEKNVNKEEGEKKNKGKESSGGGGRGPDKDSDGDSKRGDENTDEEETDLEEGPTDSDDSDSCDRGTREFWALLRRQGEEYPGPWMQQKRSNIEYRYVGDYVQFRSRRERRTVRRPRDEVGRLRYPKIMELTDKEKMMDPEMCEKSEKITDVLKFGVIKPWALKVKSPPAGFGGRKVTPGVDDEVRFGPRNWTHYSFRKGEPDSDTVSEILSLVQDGLNLS